MFQVLVPCFGGGGGYQRVRGRAAVRVGGLIGISEWDGVGGRAGWRSSGWTSFWGLAPKRGPKSKFGSISV